MMQLGEYWQTRLCVLIWFGLNMSIGSLMKWIYLRSKLCSAVNPQRCEQYDFPLFITSVHMLCCWLLCGLYLRVRRASAPDDVGGVAARDKGGSNLATWERVRSVGPLAALFAISVGLGNLSLSYVYPSFNQMVSTTTPLITMLIQILVYRSKYNWWAYISVSILSGGFTLCYKHEQNYHILGLMCCIGAAVFRAAKSVVQAYLLKDKTKSMDAVTLLYYMAPYSGLLLFCFSCATLGARPFTVFFQDGELSPNAPMVIGLTVLSGVTACLLNIFNFLVTYYTSAVVLQILGNVKVVLAIAFSSVIFGNEVSTMQWFGSGICVLGCVLYQQKGHTLKVQAAEKGADKSP